MVPIGLGRFPQDVPLAMRFDRTVAPPTAALSLHLFNKGATSHRTTAGAPFIYQTF